MNSNDYGRLSTVLLKYANDIQTAKRPGYTTGSSDVLKNFKAVADRAHLTPGQAWAVYFLKHVDAITTFMTQPDLPVSEAPDGRFADAINYLLLGFALYQEKENPELYEPPDPNQALPTQPTTPTRGHYVSGQDLGDESGHISL